VSKYPEFDADSDLKEHCRKMHKEKIIRKNAFPKNIRSQKNGYMCLTFFRALV
jgi:hypothetical protein